VSGLLAAANAAGGRDNATAILATGPLFGTPTAARRRTGDTAELVPFGRTTAPPDHPGAPATERGDVSRRSRTGVRRVLLAATVIAVLGVAVLWPTETLSPGGTSDIVATATPRVLFVSTSTGTGFSSIAAALAAAQPGDVIDVEPGIYREAIVLKDGVSIRARQRRAVILQPPDTLAGPWTAISATSMRSGGISGFVVNGTDARLEYGVWVNEASVELDDLDIAGARVAAVHVSGRSSVRLRSSVIHDNTGAGVLVDGNAAPEILHNVFSGNGRVSPPRAAIELRPGARATIAGNLFRANGQPVIGASAAELTRLHAQNALDAPPRAAR
jgi:hypothetical protein